MIAVAEALNRLACIFLLFILSLLVILRTFISDPETRKRIAEHYGEPSMIKKIKIKFPKKIPGRYVRCGDCVTSKDRKTKHCCSTCLKPICMEHAFFLCQNCIELEQEHK